MKGKALAFLGGVGVGALAMYFLDPTSGNSRRSVVRTKVVTTGRETGKAVQGRARAMASRAKSLAERSLARFDTTAPSDDVLSQRVRTALGRVISHPRMINISAQAGVVTLNGTVSEEEAQGLSATVRSVEGVKDLVDQTEVREEVAR
jgi:osmotically-inducible protein OsmY